ncbi:hypothetical protein [Salmonella phage SD-15_S21]|nr:hypothetical protein [Salmonella phage SD-15_S21]
MRSKITNNSLYSHDMEGRSSYCIIYYFEFCLFRRINLIKPRVGIGAALQSSSSCLVVFLLTFILTMSIKK